MSKTLRLVLGLVVAGLLCAPRMPVAQASGAPADPAAGKAVFVLPVKGAIDQSMLYVFRRAFREIERLAPAAVILELDTPGGRLQETREMLDWMRSLRPKTPLYAFVNPDAYSAGAILCLGTSRIFVSPGSHIGDALPIMINPLSGAIQELPADIREKAVSPTRALVRGLAQENGHNVALAEAMVDPDMVFEAGPVKCPQGKLLTLTAQEAVAPVPPDGKPLLAEAVVSSVDEVLERTGLQGARVVRFEELGAERLARWITGLGPLLLGLGILAIYVEMKTPGFGFFGMAGIALLAVYFFGHYVAGMAGYEEIALVLAGLVLLAIEIFVIPGFGVVGVLGIALILVGTLLALVPALPPEVPALPGVSPSELGSQYLTGALWRVAVTAAVVGSLGWLATRILPRTAAYRRLVLDAALGQERGVVVGAGRYEGYVGREGVARTDLRPAGSAEFGDERLDVVTSGDLIEKGARVRIVRVEGTRIVVESVAQ